MASKPLTAFSWATAGDRVTPSTDKILKGYVTRERPSAAGLNDHLFRIGEWSKYLSEGALSGDHSIDGALVTSGNTTVGGQPFTFVDFTFTADATTDQIAHTAHGLETGDGPVHVTNAGGALPGGLAPGVDYYFIKIDADHGQLSNSRSNALGEFAIDLTTNGTGTQTLLHQSGTTRVADAEVTRNLKVDNNLRVDGNIFTFGTLGVVGDLTVDGSIKRGSLRRFIPPLAGHVVAGSPTIVGNRLYSFSGTSDVISVPIVLEEGETLTAVRVKVSCGATTVIQVNVGENDPDAHTATGSIASSSGHASATENIDFALSIAAASSELITIELTPTAFSGAAFFRGIEITTIRP